MVSKLVPLVVVKDHVILGLGEVVVEHSVQLRLSEALPEGDLLQLCLSGVQPGPAPLVRREVQGFVSDSEHTVPG